MKKLIWLSFFIIHAFHEGVAQDGLPVSYAQLESSYRTINPTYQCKDENLEFVSGIQQLTGAFNGFRSFYLNASVALSADTNAGSRQVVGLTFLNDVQGTVFRTTKAYGSYSYHLAFSEKWRLAAGTSFGFSNFRIDGTVANQTASAIAPDANVGLLVYSNRLYFGLSGNQIFNNSLRPIDQEIPLRRHFIIFSNIVVPINQSFDFFAYSIVRMSKRKDIDLQLMGRLQEKFLFGVSGRRNRGVAGMVGLERISILHFQFSFLISYQLVVSSKTYSPPESVELSLKFLLN